jgi:GT2 family glycosyltransferase
MEATAQSAEAARVTAHLDGFEGTYLVGWAWSDSAKPCVISVRDETGAQIAQGEASRPRRDLAALGLDRSDFAFRVHVPDLGTAEFVRVFADGVELYGSPLPVGQGHYDGHVYAHDGFATGWVTERLQLFSPPQIDIAGGDGVVVARAVSERNASDSEPGFSPARFRIPLTPLFGNTDVAITARANGVAFARATANLRLISNLEIAAPEHCAGWMFSPDAPWARFAVEIRRDGALVATVPCDRVRHDVRTSHPGSNAFGFDVALPRAGTAPDEPCEFSFRLPGSQRELFGGPLIIGERAGVVAAARRLARRVHNAASTLSPAERSFLQRALADYTRSVRQGRDAYSTPRFAHRPQPSTRRLTVVIPVYRDVEITQACIRSVLSHRNADTDFVLIVNDASPEAGMATVLAGFARERNVQLLTNESNRGFVKTVNRAFRAVPDGDVVLLNSDAEVFAGAFDELYRVAHAKPEIGTVTPLSNNATIFSYPHAELRRHELSDVPWPRLAQIARERNADTIVDVPTAHGFCMLIKREVLERIGGFDESFGRGYGEENDFCAKAADLGFRNVAAGSVFVFHHESVSFAAEKTELLTKNLGLIANRYPEYHPTIMAFEREDRMRSVRWRLDAARLAAAREAGAQFTLAITHGLDGGTAEAIRDIAEACAPANGPQLVLSCRDDGFLQLRCDAPLFRAVFSQAERRALFRMLTAAAPALVAIHQVLGYDADFIREFADWIRPFRSVFYVHDYFAICPRVTMIDSSGSFCGKPPVDVCDRCIAVGGAHAASRLKSESMEEHLQLMQSLLARVAHVVAPSESAASYLKKAWPDLDVQIVPHPESGRQFPAKARDGSDDEILVLGAIGPHKGSAKLFEIARLARLRYPQLQFRLIGYSDIDRELLAVGNVAITGAYAQAELPALIAQCRGRLALFLHLWPETHGYTLTEAVAHGFIPLVPDIGAPAGRVRETGFGVVFPFPVDAHAVLALIDEIAAGKREPFVAGASPQAYRRSPEDLARLRALLGVTEPRADTRAG